MQFICLKEKKFHRSLSLCLVFFISFSIFSFSFVPRKTVKANPLVPVIESELAPIIVNILSAFGVVISIPTAQDFLNEEKEFCTQKALELQNHEGAVTKGIQALKEGFYVSKEFVTDVLDKWEEYRIKKSLTSKVSDCSIESMSGITSHIDDDSETYMKFINSLLAPFNGTVVTGSYCKFYFHDMWKNRNRWTEITTFHKSTSYESCIFDSPLRCSYRIIHDSLYNGVYFDFNGRFFSFSREETNGFKLTWGRYESKVSANKQVIDNVLEPVNEKNQGLVISPKSVEAVGKVLNPTIPDVKDSQITVDVPISSIASTVPHVVNGSDVGALPWGDVGSIDKPTDIPKDESKDIPKDESKDTPKDEAGVDFSPFLTLGTGLKDVFPFCLPFDLIKNLHLLSAPPQAPHFDIDFKKAGLVGGDVVSIDFSQFELLAKIIRFFLTLGFIYFLIIKTRDMIRG